MYSLITICDGLGPSIFCRKMEKARPMREEMDGKGASYEGRAVWKSWLFPAGVGFFSFDVIIQKILFPICTLTWRVNNYVCRQEKV